MSKLFKFFPTPEYLLLSNAGLAITDDGVKFVEFKHSMFSGEATLSHAENFPLPEGVVQAGFINEPEKLDAVLKEIKKRFKLKYVHATLPEERAYLFATTIDKVPEEGVRDAVAFVLEENVPLSLSGAVFDFSVLGEDSSGKLKIVASALSKKAADFYVEALEKAGITPVSFDIESQAIARAVIPKGDNSTQLIINLGSKKTGFYVVGGGVVQFTTTSLYGLSDPAHLDNLKAEMEKVFSFWNAKEGKETNLITKAIVSGVGVKNTETLPNFMKGCPAPYTIANPLSNIRGGKLENSLDYTSAIGAALYNKMDRKHV